MRNLITQFKIEPYYTVTYRDGNIKIQSFSDRKRGSEIKQGKNHFGYLIVKLNNKTELLHRIIAKHFLGEPSKEKPTVNHIDGDKLNNRVENLEYLSIADNVKHAVKIGLHPSADPKRSGRYKDGRSTKANITQYKRDWIRKKRGIKGCNFRV